MRVNMLRKLTLSLFVSVSVLFLTASAAAQFPIAGQVVDVIDGKTLLVTIPSGNVKVELQYIDVPEAGQELHDTIKDHLRKLTIGKTIVYRPKRLLKDHAVGQVTIRDLDVSQQMLRDGAAWHSPKESSGQEKAEFEVYASLAEAARKEKLGVWSRPDLRPAWEFRAENKEREKQLQQGRYKSFSPSVPLAVGTRKLPRQKGNPALGNIGALANGYDRESGNGYLGTSYLTVNDAGPTADYRTAVDISYFYKQDEAGRRTGKFVISVISMSQKWRFLTANNLVLTGGKGKDMVIGKPKRTSSVDGDDMREKLVYEISRPALERIVNDDETRIKIGTYMIEMVPSFKYVLQNLLEVSR